MRCLQRPDRSLVSVRFHATGREVYGFRNVDMGFLECATILVPAADTKVYVKC